MGKRRNAASSVDHAADEVGETANVVEVLVRKAIKLFDDYREQGYVEITISRLGVPVRIMLPEQR